MRTHLLLPSTLLIVSCSSTILDVDALYRDHSEPFQTDCDYHQTEEGEGFFCGELMLSVRSWGGDTSHDDAVQALIEGEIDGTLITDSRLETRDTIELSGATYPISISTQWTGPDEDPRIIGAAIHVSREHDGSRDLYSCDMPVNDADGVEQTYTEWGAWCADNIAAMIAASP